MLAVSTDSRTNGVILYNANLYLVIVFDRGQQMNSTSPLTDSGNTREVNNRKWHSTFCNTEKCDYNG